MDGEISEVFDFIALKRSVGEYIDSLHLEPGDRIPTENKLCRKFEASHYQVRKVLAELNAERGWVTIQGSGTYIPGGLERRRGSGSSRSCARICTT